jgi:DNA-binding transcriptional MerR regulator
MTLKQNGNLTIGVLAKQTGLSTDTLRYYEKMGLIRPVRSSSGYRLYRPEVVRILRFIIGAKSLDFTLEEIRALLEINSSDRATCEAILSATDAKIEETQMRIGELKEIQNILIRLSERCPGGKAPVQHCPIMEYIQQSKAYAEPRKKTQAR